MPNKKILKAVIETNQQEKTKKEVEQFLTTFIRKAKIKGIDITSPDFKTKIDEIQNKMLGKPLVDTKEGLLSELTDKMIGLKQIFEDIDLLKVELENCRNVETETNSEVEQTKERINNLEEKEIDWEEIQNKPEIILQDEFYQEQQTIEENQKRSFNLFQLLKNKIENVQNYFNQIIKGISSEITQLRNKKINHSELLGITKDQHHAEKHILESHLNSKLMDRLLKLSDDNFLKQLTPQIIEKYPYAFEPWGITKNDFDTLYINEVIGTGDGGITTFYLTYDPLNSSKVMIYIGTASIWQDDDYTISGKTITLLYAAPDGAKVRAVYYKD